jgi:Ca-activated chloride channel family protein
MEAEYLDATPLATLRDDLRRLQPTADQNTINDQWTRALEILTDFTEDTPPRRPFWKRPK